MLHVHTTHTHAHMWVVQKEGIRYNLVLCNYLLSNFFKGPEKFVSWTIDFIFNLIFPRFYDIFILEYF